MRWCLIGVVAVVSVAGCGPSQPKVEQFGAMRHVMREGHTEARIALTGAVSRPNAIAVGAMEGLNGEVTIVDGKVWVSRPKGDGLVVTGPGAFADDHATLLTLAHVDAWREVSVTSRVQGAALEALIESVARAEGVDTTKPFPFVIEGNLLSMNVHVINGYCPIAVDPATVEAQPWRWSNPSPRHVVIVGFYAADAAGVMTHHGSSVHAHAITSIDGKTITGHVDDVTVEAGMTLRVPAAR